MQKNSICEFIDKLVDMMQVIFLSSRNSTDTSTGQSTAISLCSEIFPSSNNIFSQFILGIKIWTPSSGKYLQMYLVKYVWL